MNSFYFGINALRQAYFIQRRLLKEGTIADLVSVGRGEDRATKGDWESEEIVINYLKRENIPAKIITEEHGTIELGDKYLVLVDGIDGSSQMVKNPNCRCGTIISIAENLNPRYEDFIFAAITEYVTKNIIYGVRGEGVFEIVYENGVEIKSRFPSFTKKTFSEITKVMVDCYKADYAEGITEGMDKFEKFMNEHVVQYLEGKVNVRGGISSGSMCIDLLSEDVDAVFNMVAKGVFEPPAMYLLTKELGGFGTDLNGNDLGEKQWKPVGMNLDGALFSSSYEIGNKLIKLLRKDSIWI